MKDEPFGGEETGRSQRRDVTVLFADLVGSTKLSRRLDLEAYHKLLNRFLQDCGDEIAKAEGYVARFMGDGVLAYFGFPQAHEDDAVRAVAAALSIRDRCARLGEESGVVLCVRCGIASGNVILGSAIGFGGAREFPVFGDVANLAARLQAAARANSILVAAATRKRASLRFGFERSAPLRLGGFPQVNFAWEVSGLRSSGQPAGRSQRPSGRMIGRNAENALFKAAWRDARAGRGIALQVSGQAGVGKSRLVQDWMRQIARAGFKTCLAVADPLHRQSPLHLIASLLETLPGGIRKRRRVVEYLDWSMPVPEGGADDGANHAGLLAKAMLDMLEGAPTLLVVEDIHWADESSRMVIDAISDRIRDSPSLIVVTTRAMADDAAAVASVCAVPLAPLTSEQTALLVARVAGTRLSEREQERVVERSGGVPLFAQELARLVSCPSDCASPDSIPDTLSSLLLARLTTLGPAMAMAQCAAVLGAEVPLSNLEALARRRGVDLIGGLHALEREAVAWVHGTPATLRFQHSLYRDAALSTLLRTDRQLLFRDAAEVFEAAPASGVPDAALAEFWLEAGLPERALIALDRAMSAAQAKRAWRETGQLAESALSLFRALPENARSIRRELALQTMLAEALQITCGYSSPAACAAATDAHRLAERAGEIQQSMLGVAGKWMAASSAGDYLQAHAIAARALSLAQLHGGPDALAAAHMIDMTTRYRIGDLIGAEASFRSGDAFFHTRDFVQRTGAIPQTFGNAAIIAVLLGASDVARDRSAHALRTARQQGTTYDRCFAAYMVAMVEIMLGADRKASFLGKHALRLAGELGFPQFEATARIVVGRARAGLGEIGAGVALLRAGLAAMTGTHSRNAQTLYLTWLAEAALSGSDWVGALEATEAALGINAEERFYRPETLRIRALALLGSGAPAEAEAALCEGEALAAAMQSPWFIQRLLPLRTRFEPLASR